VRIKARYQAPNGNLYPLLICSLETNPVSMINKARAIYFDGTTGKWVEIQNENDRLELARAVEAGTLEVTKDWKNHL
jgi:hypothetical protein